MQITSEPTGVIYDSNEAVKIFNPVQYGKYVANGAEVIDFGTEDGKFFLVFNKKGVQSLFDKWCRHEL